MYNNTLKHTQLQVHDSYNFNFEILLRYSYAKNNKNKNNNNNNNKKNNNNIHKFCTFLYIELYESKRIDVKRRHET